MKQRLPDDSQQLHSSVYVYKHFDDIIGEIKNKYENNKHNPLYFQLHSTLFQSQKSPQLQFQQTFRSLEVPWPCRALEIEAPACMIQTPVEPLPPEGLPQG